MLNEIEGLLALAESQDVPEEIENIIIRNSFDINKCWVNDTSLLMVAARKGHIKTVEMLLRLGTDVNARNKNGKTALMEAAKKCNTDVMKVLLANGADRDARDKDFWTASSFTFLHNNKKCWDLLSEYTIKVQKEIDDERAWKNPSWKQPEPVSMPVPVPVPVRRSKHTIAVPTETMQDCQREPAKPTDVPHTWLYPLLTDAGFPARVIEDCEQKLVHQQAIYSAQVFALIPRSDMNFTDMGITQLGVQHTLMHLHAQSLVVPQKHNGDALPTWPFFLFLLLLAVMLSETRR